MMLVDVRYCNITNTPPRKKAMAFAPFLTKTPAHMPQTVPKESSYRLRDDLGGSGGGTVSDELGSGGTCAAAGEVA